MVVLLFFSCTVTRVDQFFRWQTFGTLKISIYFPQKLSQPIPCHGEVGPSLGESRKNVKGSQVKDAAAIGALKPIDSFFYHTISSSLLQFRRLACFRSVPTSQHSCTYFLPLPLYCCCSERSSPSFDVIVNFLLS